MISLAFANPNTWPSKIISKDDSLICSCDIEGEIDSELRSATRKVHRQLLGLDLLLEPETGSNSFFTDLFQMTGRRSSRVIYNEPMLIEANQSAANIGRWLFAPSLPITTFNLGKFNPKNNFLYGFIKGESLKHDSIPGFLRYHPVIGLDSFVLEHLNNEEISESDAESIFDFIRLAVFLGGHDHVHQSVYTIENPLNHTSFCHPDSLAARNPIPPSLYKEAIKQTLPSFIQFDFPIEAYSSCLSAFGWDSYKQHDPDFINQLCFKYSEYLETVLKVTSLKSCLTDQSYARRYLTIIPLIFFDSIFDIDYEFLAPQTAIAKQISNTLKIHTQDGLDGTLKIAHSFGIESYRRHPERNKFKDEVIDWTIRFYEIISNQLLYQQL